MACDQPESRKVAEGVIAVIERDEQWLMIRRAEGVIAPGHWCFPGGAIEPGETQPEALVREIEEELGIRVKPGRPLWEWRHPHDALVLHWWSARAEDSMLDEIQPNPAEVAEVRWIDRKNVLTLQPSLISSVAFVEHARKSW